MARLFSGLVVISVVLVICGLICEAKLASSRSKPALARQRIVRAVNNVHLMNRGATAFHGAKAVKTGNVAAPNDLHMKLKKTKAVSPAKIVKTKSVKKRLQPETHASK